MNTQKTKSSLKSKKSENGAQFKRGMHNGIPIGLGYFFVSFSLGIAAKSTGLTAFQAAFMSFSIHASAGEFAALAVIKACAGYIEMAFTEIVVNLRYLLMSCALSQKITPKTKLIHRFLIAFDITDEIFAVSVSSQGKVNPFYIYGMMSVASPGWVAGTFLGAALGGILPAIAVGAMSIALYGMFISVLIPSAQKDKSTAIVVSASMIISAAFALAPVLKELSSGAKIIIITIAVSAVAAVLFPRSESASENDTHADVREANDAE